jgi:hypothetical protein
VAVLLLCLLLVSCRSRRQPAPTPPPAKVLTDIPSHQSSRTTWDTSATCVVYNSLGNESVGGVAAVSTALRQVLTENGYRVVEIDTYMDSRKRNAVDKIIRVEQYVPRGTKQDGATVWDCMVELVVEPRADRPGDVSADARRHFEVWGRKKGGYPYLEVAQEAMRIDGFRQALEP